MTDSIRSLHAFDDEYDDADGEIGDGMAVELARAMLINKTLTLMTTSNMRAERMR